jgi:hypothetical protein
VQENEQENWLLLQQLQGLAEAFPRHLGPPWVLVERFTSQGGSNYYGDLLESAGGWPLWRLFTCRAARGKEKTQGLTEWHTTL